MNAMRKDEFGYKYGPGGQKPTPLFEPDAIKAEEKPKESPVFCCPQCNKACNYYRHVTTVNRENFTPFHELAFTTQVITNIDSVYHCSNCQANVTEIIKKNSKGAKT